MFSKACNGVFIAKVKLANIVLFINANINRNIHWKYVLFKFRMLKRTIRAVGTSLYAQIKSLD